MEPKRHLIRRVLAGAAALLAGPLALEYLTHGFVLAGFAGPSLHDYLSLLVGISLVALCAAGMKYALRLRIRYWILFLVLLVVSSLIVVALHAAVLLG